MKDNVSVLRDKLARHGLKYKWLFENLRKSGCDGFSEGSLRQILGGERPPGVNGKYIDKGLELLADYEHHFGKEKSS